MLTHWSYVFLALTHRCSNFIPHIGGPPVDVMQILLHLNQSDLCGQFPTEKLMIHLNITTWNMSVGAKSCINTSSAVYHHYFDGHSSKGELPRASFTQTLLLLVEESPMRRWDNNAIVFSWQWDFLWFCELGVEPADKLAHIQLTKSQEKPCVATGCLSTETANNTVSPNRSSLKSKFIWVLGLNEGYITSHNQ